METRLPGSFRDPAGHVFLRDGIIHRQIDPPGAAAYRRLMDSGLYAALTADRLLVPHEDLGADPEVPGAVTVLRPQQVPMISYPYEWSLSQLRDAALVTLRAQQTAIRFGMVLKDASAFNVQFLDGRPTLIDTLSFEPYRGGPWVAYRQFCQHFYAPLVLGAARDPRLVRMASLFIDGLPLPAASRLLPRVSYLRPGPLFHIHLHAAAEQKWSADAVGRAPGETRPGPPERTTSSPPSTRALEALAGSLERAVQAVRWTSRSEWAGYYGDAESYSREAFATKTEIVTRWLDAARPGTVWDLGANTGHFSKAAARLGATAVAFDADPACVDTLYREVREGGLERVLPLVLDLAAPSPGIGWANSERMTLEARGPADMLLALAVTHHLAIGNNVPLAAVADYFARLGRRAIVEFVPKSDPMVRRMLRSREDVFDRYDQPAFEDAFGARFVIDERVIVAPSDRLLYLMTTR